MGQVLAAGVIMLFVKEIQTPVLMELVCVALMLNVVGTMVSARKEVAVLLPVLGLLTHVIIRIIHVNVALMLNVVGTMVSARMEVAVLLPVLGLLTHVIIRI